MIPLALIGVGVLALAAGTGILLTFGARFRIGRLLASAPAVSIGEAVELARAGEGRFVRVQGRIDSDDEFEDADHQPLVLRRTRIEHARDARLALHHRAIAPRGWHALDVRVESVAFRLNEGLDSIELDTAALGVGLVVVPRRSVGVVSDLGERVDTASLPPDAPARLTVEQVSSVEHAIAVGVPVVRDGRPILTAGAGRPLILTTLEIPEAMRILTGGAVGRTRAAFACLAGGGALVIVGVVGWIVTAVAAPTAALAESPASSILPGADTRSAGQGPGLVGDPALAILAVLAIALIAVLGTLAYVRLTSPPAPPARPR